MPARGLNEVRDGAELPPARP